MNDAKRYTIKYEVYPEDGMFIARCAELDIVSDGETDAEAVTNLREAIELYFERNAEAAIMATERQQAEDDENQA